jgi:hypothetical protein
MREIDTYILLVELHNRLDDYLCDPEPAYDPSLQNIRTEYIVRARDGLLQLRREIRKELTNGTH